MKISIRPLSGDDYAAAARIFFCAVHEGTRSAYTYPQRLVWGGQAIDLDHWRARISKVTGFVADHADEPVGFMTIDRSGYVDLAFVMPSAMGQGVGKALLAAVEGWAKENGARQLSTAASLVARPFFLNCGWQVLEEEQVQREGITLNRFRMGKEIQ